MAVISQICGFNAQGLSAQEVAAQAFKILLEHSLSVARMADALVEGMSNANSFQAARDAMPLLERLPKLTEPQAAILGQAITENGQVGNAIRISERIRALVGRSAK